MGDTSRTPTAPALTGFIFEGRAIALRGSIHQPFFQELGNHAVATTYAGSPVLGTSESTNFSLANIISYRNARSQVSAEVDGTAPRRTFRTRVESTVEGLSVLDGRIRADRVVSVLRSDFDERDYPQRRAPRISPSGSRFENLVIDGQVQMPSLPPAFSREDDDPETSLPIITATPFHKDGLGTIFFAEWVFVGPLRRDRQALVMLRITLNSGNVAACIEIAQCDDDGSPIDP